MNAETGHRSTKDEETGSNGTPKGAAASSLDQAGAANHDHSMRPKRRRKRRRNKLSQVANHGLPQANIAQSHSTNGALAGEKAAGKELPQPEAKPLQDQNTTEPARAHPAKRGKKHGKNQVKRQTRLGALRQNHQPLYAALDLGTNNCRLLIAKPTRAGQFYVVDAFSRIVRLGEGLDKNGCLSQSAMDRAAEALKICATKLERQPVKKYRLIATEACRQADNGASFLDRVKRETDLELEIINRETEARLAVSGCASLVGQNVNSVILFDIGGGSSEIALIKFDGKRSPRLANHIVAWTSLPVGVVTLSERHGGKVVTQEIFDKMVEEVTQLISNTAPDNLLNFEPDVENFHLLGTSGTVTTLAGLHLELPRYDRRQVDGLWMKNGDVDNMLQKLLSWDIDKRSANPCIGPDRSDLVLAGCAIMQAIRHYWPSNRMRVADRGLREGLLNDMMARDGVWRRRKRHYRPKGQRGAKHGNSPTTQPTHQPKGNQS